MSCLVGCCHSHPLNVDHGSSIFRKNSSSSVRADSFELGHPKNWAGTKASWNGFFSAGRISFTGSLNPFFWGDTTCKVGKDSLQNMNRIINLFNSLTRFRVCSPSDKRSSCAKTFS
jgi:hypothetical protein